MMKTQVVSHKNYSDSPYRRSDIPLVFNTRGAMHMTATRLTVIAAAVLFALSTLPAPAWALSTGGNGGGDAAGQVGGNGGIVGGDG